jgi:C4-dicarboxylate transporter DctQ subunit
MTRILLRALDRAEEGFIAFALLLTTLITFVNVVLRYGFDVGVAWSEELVRYLMIWITFIGIAVAVRRGTSINMDFFARFGSITVRRILWLAQNLIGVLFGAALLYWGTKIFLANLDSVRISPALGVKMAWIYLIFPLGGFLLTLRYVEVLRSTLVRLRKGEPLPIEETRR